MKRSSKSLVSKVKLAVLSMVTVGMVYASACTVGDLGYNVVSGTLAFVKGYTTDVWEAVLPAPGELMGE